MTASGVRALGSMTIATWLSVSDVHAEPFYFDTGNTDGQMAAATRPAGAAVEIEAADDFPLESQTTITTAVFVGLVPTSDSASDVSSVAVEIYRIFPFDSVSPPSSNVPTRTNSPADVVYANRTSETANLSFTVTLNSPGFVASNSVINGIHPVPTQTTGGEGAVSGNEVVITATLSPPLALPAGHYFFVPQVALASGTFLWLSAPKPIVAPGTTFTGDLQSWIRNADLAPDWLRIGTDIVGSGSFNQTFALYGTNDIIFRNGFD